MSPGTGNPPFAPLNRFNEQEWGKTDPSREYTANGPLNLSPLLPPYRTHGHKVLGSGQQEWGCEGGCQPVFTGWEVIPVFLVPSSSVLPRGDP